MQTQAAGQNLATELRTYFSIGTRTRRYRTRRDYRMDLHAEMVEAIELAAQYPGYFSQPRQDRLAAASAVAYSYRKHVEGYRISGSKISAIQAMSPWQFASFLGQMVDAGVENAGQGEQFLNTWTA